MNRNCCVWKQKWRMSAMEDENDLEEVEHEASDFGEEDLQKAGVMIEDLNWRVEKLRLEEANKRRFLKAKPVFLPYKDCSRWVQAWGQRWMTAKDWWVDFIFRESVRLDHILCYLFLMLALSFALRTGKTGFQWERNETRIFPLARMNITVGQGIGSLG